MIYSVELTIPANTTTASPAEADLAVAWGVVTQLWVRWRWGPGNLCGVKVLRENLQVWPSSGGKWFPSTPGEMTWQDYYNVGDVPFFFTVQGYNLDDTFPHTVYVAVNLQRPSISESLKAFLEYLTKGP